MSQKKLTHAGHTNFCRECAASTQRAEAAEKENARQQRLLDLIAGRLEMCAVTIDDWFKEDPEPQVQEDMRKWAAELRDLATRASPRMQQFVDLTLAKEQENADLRAHQAALGEG